MMIRSSINKGTIASFALLACSVGFALLTCEVAVRAHEASRRTPVIHSGDMLADYDTLLGWVSKPNSTARFESREYAVSFRLNGEGTRGPSRVGDSAAAGCRVLLIGDSFAFGYPVQFEETVGEVVRRQLKSKSERDCDVLTLATVSYSTDQELLLFERDGRRYRPDVTILMFYFNDIYCNIVNACKGLAKPVFRLENDELVLRNVPVPSDKSPEVDGGVEPMDGFTGGDQGGFQLKAKRWLNRHSHLYHLAYSAISAERPAVPNEFRVFKRTYDADIAEAWTVTGKLIARLRDAAARNGSDFIVFLIPHEAAVYPDRWRSAKRAHSMTAREWSVDRVEIELSGLCVAEGLDCILPTIRFRDEAERIVTEGKRLYFEADKHWTSQGHALAADLLVEHLLTHRTLERLDLAHRRSMARSARNSAHP